MQACLYSVFLRKRMAVVLSARQVWYLQLQWSAGERKCSVAISGGKRWGKSSFLRHFVQFLTVARTDGVMSTEEHRDWQAALGQGKETEAPPRTAPKRRKHDDKRHLSGKPKKGNHNPGPRGGHTSTGSRGGNRRNTQTGRDKVGKPNKRVSGLDTALTKFSDCHEPTKAFAGKCDVAACTTLKEGGSDSSGSTPLPLDGGPISIDSNGVVVPWLDQISVSRETLGKGRSGSVTKNEWDGRDVAVKKFSLTDADDERSMGAVYHHELHVMTSLQSLWGKYVPQLFFRQPWPTSPMIGMQLGEPMPDNFDDWDSVDLARREAAVSAVEALGWRQTDFRGSNFVRLPSTNNSDDSASYIAMVDFETFRKL